MRKGKLKTGALGLVLVLTVASGICAEDILLNPPLLSGAPWHHPLYIGGEGYWQARIAVEVINDTDQDMAGVPVSIPIGTGQGKLDLVGAEAIGVRVCDMDGGEFLFDIVDSTGAPARNGLIAEGSSLVIPVECKTGSARTCYVYFNNPWAWPVPDFFEASSGARDETPRVKVRTGTKEEMNLAAEPSADVWFHEDDGSWFTRVPVKVLNFEDKPTGEKLVYVMPGLRVKGSRNAASLLLDASGKVIPHFRLGDSMMFFGSAMARSVSRYNVYFSGSKPAAPDGHATYELLMNHAGNLVQNASFEDGDEFPKSWKTGPADMSGRVSPGAFGNYCVRVKADDAVGWIGWRQDIPVEPNATYFYGCYVKTENITGGQVRLHAHFRDRDGNLSKKNGFFGTSDSVQGTSDWTLLSSLMRIPEDAVSVELHLTMNSRGTVWHDGVVLYKVLQAASGQVEYKNAEELTDFTVWQVNPLIKVFREDIPGGLPEEIHIYVARNECEPIQLAIRSSLPLEDVMMTVHSPANIRGEKLEKITVERVGYVPIDHPSSYYETDLPPWRRAIPVSPGRTDGWAGWWPDPLIPVEKFALPANTTQPIWITVSVPKTASAGDYTGSIHIKVSNASARVIPLRVTVWDFELPDESHLKVIYDLRSGRGWNFLNEENRMAWYRLMSDHRISPGLLPAPDIRYEASRVIMNTAEFDRAASYCLDELNMNIFYSPWQFYCFGWGHPPREFQGFKPFTPEYDMAYSTCLKSFMEHLREKGWDKKVVLYISDEPHYQTAGIIQQMQKLCDMIHAAEPGVRIYSSTWQHVPEWNGYLDVWGVGAYGTFPVDEMKARLKAGDEIWFTTDGQMATDTPYCAIERLYPYYCWKYGASGYEFWGVSWWTYDPFKFGWHSYIRQSPEPGRFVSVRYPNGDGFLTYPGWMVGIDRPISSVRLKQVREGIEDYEYLCLLKRNIESAKKAGIDTATAEEAIKAAEELVKIPNAGGLRSTEILPDPDAVIRIRQRIGEEIMRLGN